MEVFVDLLREAVVNDVLADAVVSLTDAVEMAALVNGIGINVILNTMILLLNHFSWELNIF